MYRQILLYCKIIINSYVYHPKYAVMCSNVHMLKVSLLRNQMKKAITLIQIYPTHFKKLISNFNKRTVSDISIDCTVLYSKCNLYLWNYTDTIYCTLMCIVVLLEIYSIYRYVFNGNHGNRTQLIISCWQFLSVLSKD